MNLREIDRLVAEKVMGWKIKKVIEDGCYLYDEWDTGDKGIPVEKFRPTLNITDAWQVVEKLTYGKTDLETYFELQLFYIHYYAKFGKHEAKAETATLAICLAALKAVGVEMTETAEETK
jgi:Phage ABA sandwich domain